MKQYHERCHAYRVSLFSVIAFTAIGQTGSYFPRRTLFVILSSEAADQNKRPPFLLHRPISEDASQADVMGLGSPVPVETHRLCLLCFLVNIKYF